MVDKLSKALEGLKSIQFASSVEDKSISKKEKMFFCVLAADVMVSLKVVNNQNIPTVIEYMINLCNDQDSDVRMVAEESLNKIIMSVPETNMLKIQVELHKIIKKNGPVRCLRVALTRFGQLSCYIRPTKGKAHAQMLVPSLIEISKRQEENLHETLASSFENIFKALGVFIQDNALKTLIKAFLHNLSSSNPVIRRCSATCIVTIVQYCRRPYTFNCYVLNSLLDCVIPVCEDNTSDLILGVLGCLRLLLPRLTCTRTDEGITGSFGLRRRQDECILSVDRLIQTYELCLYYTNNKDHNIVAAALETLNQILQNPPQQLETFFLSPAGFSRSYIHLTKENKLSSRSESEMSVACSLPPLDESALFDESDSPTHFLTLSPEEKEESNNEYLKVNEKQKFLDEEIKFVENPFKEKSLGRSIGSQSIIDIESDTESTAASDLNTPFDFVMRIETENKTKEDFLECSRSNSIDDLYSPGEEEKCLSVLTRIDVGSFTDPAVPLVYCARHLAASFLLDGSPNCLKSDRLVRVSIKSLALSSISSIIKLYPIIMKMNLRKTSMSFSNQEISDVLLYSDHIDPQIRGFVSILVGHFIYATLLESKGCFSHWFCENKSKLNCTYLVEIILKGFKDVSSVCTLKALSAVNLFINKAMCSAVNGQFRPILDYLPALRNNSYWLVKVKLVEVVASLPYMCIYDLMKSEKYQEEIIDKVLLPFLGDEDSRVRHAAAEALVKIIPQLYYGTTLALDYSKYFTNCLNSCLKTKKDFLLHLHPFPPFSYLLMESEEAAFNEKIDFALSRVVAKISYFLMVPLNKFFLFGYLEALALLAQKFPTTVYLNGWNCWKPDPDMSDHEYFLTSNLITVVLSLLVSSPLILDLTAFSNGTLLLCNLFAGLCISYLKKSYLVSNNPGSGEHTRLWNVFTNEKFSQLAKEIFTHLIKVLGTYSHLVEEVAVSSVAESTSTNAFLPLLSPIKKTEKKAEERLEDKKTKHLHQTTLTNHYIKLQQLLKKSYANFKVSLDKSVGDKFLNFLESTLQGISVVLEVATIQETGPVVEEILSYLETVISLRPKSTVLCVIQLLKSLFGTNLATNWDNGNLSTFNFVGINLFDSVFHLPFESLFEKIRRRTNFNTLECENLSRFNSNFERKLIVKNADKQWLATYIRLFEPMVVKSLQLYTITGDIEFQVSVLKLLNKLVQLRVNYCLLDAKQVFLGFVLTQFDLIEHGQMPGVEELLPYIFKFLIVLSNQRQHSKPIISIPKIMQLCDGLMASDQSVQTHCIPALVPLVEDIFLSRNLLSSVEEKELETQREVLLSMLLRLAEFPQVMDMLTLILNESKTFEEKEKWKRWSRQVVDALLPLANQDRLQIDSVQGQNSFVKLMSSVSVNVLRPIDPLLKALFVEPSDLNSCSSMIRWLSKVTVLLETVLFVKEDALLNRVEEISPNINLNTFIPMTNLSSPDPFNVKSVFQAYESSETIARFIFKVISVTAIKILECFSSSFLLQQKLSKFFVCVYYVIKSGVFHRITSSLQNLLSKEQEAVAAICVFFQRMKYFCPILTCQFSYFLAILNYCCKNYWSNVLCKPSTLPEKLVQSCGVIALSDYLCDNLSDEETLHYLLANNIEEIIVFSHEIPVKELLATIHKRKLDWGLLIKAISSNEFHLLEPRFIEKLLRLLELSENFHCGALLNLLLKQFIGSPRLALSLLAGSIASRQVEFLLTLPKEKVVSQIDSQNFKDLISFFKNDRYLKRHLSLLGLLNKLNKKIFDLSTTESKEQENIETERLKYLVLNEEWYFNRVKERCCQTNSNSREISLLLSKLKYDKIVEIMSNPSFDLKILRFSLNSSAVSNEFFDSQGRSCVKKKHLELNDSLHRAAKFSLFKMINELSEEISSVKIHLSEEPINQPVVKKLFEGKNFYKRFWEMSKCVADHLEIIFFKNTDIEDENLKSIFQTGVLCLEMIRWELLYEKNHTDEPYPKNLENGLKCCSLVIKSRKISCLLSETSNRETLNRLVQNIYFIISHIIPPCCFIRIFSDKDNNNLSEKSVLEFLVDFITKKANNTVLPNYLFNTFRDLIVNVCRIPYLSLDILKAPVSNGFQDIESLEKFISKFSVIGWSSKQQFEEIWVALLSVLGFNSKENILPEEIGFVVQASEAAVEGITTLLKNTMLDSGNKKLIRHGRDSLSMKNIYEKLPLTKSIFQNVDFNDRFYHFLDNLEISPRDDRYIPGQLSVEYLWTAVKQISSHVNVYEKHKEELNAIGLDLPSCIHLLTELYNQWIFQPSPNIKIITSTLKSCLIISDLFTDMHQFHWLLSFCLRIEEIVITDDIVILPLIILGCSKAGSIVLPDNEVCEKIKKIMLKSSSLPCRLAATQGLLFLLQSYIVCYAVNHTTLPPAGSAFHTEEANFVANIVDTFLPVALEIIHQFKTNREPVTEDYDRCHWSLIFFLLQHYQSSLGDLKDEYLNFILITLYTKNCSNTLMTLLIRGIERLLLTTVIEESFKDQLSKVSCEIILRNSTTVAKHGLQLLSILSFLDKRVKDIRESVIGVDDPEKIMKDMEKVNTLFEKLKKSYPKEAEVVGEVISYVLIDFTPSDVLTKVIQEFLSTHQPHQKILASLLFKVFERAELRLLEDWVVFSLPSFIEGLPLTMSVWTLNCFFVSASSDQWLRSLFPLVQSRIRMAELEDKKLLCLSAVQFYNQLKQECQKNSFLQTFEKAATINSIFHDLLSILR